MDIKAWPRVPTSLSFRPVLYNTKACAEPLNVVKRVHAPDPISRSAAGEVDSVCFLPFTQMLSSLELELDERRQTTTLVAKGSHTPGELATWTRFFPSVRSPLLALELIAFPKVNDPSAEAATHETAAGFPVVSTSPQRAPPSANMYADTTKATV